MKVTVTSDEGRELFSYDTRGESRCLFPADDRKPPIANALRAALAFLNPAVPARRGEWRGSQ